MPATMFRDFTQPFRVRGPAGGGRGFRSNAVLVLVAAIVVALSGGAARAEEWGPWAEGREFPALPSPADETPLEGKATVSHLDGPAGIPLIAFIRLYQTWFSPVYGDRCQMVPSCSQYGIDAIRKHGPVVGVVMASGRLLHEADERRYAPIRMSGRRYLFVDPVENNDFWFGAR